MSKRMRRGEMLDFLRGKRATVATSKQLGESGEYLTRVLPHDREAFLTPAEAARILNAYESTRAVPSAVGSVGGGLGRPSRLEPSDSTAERIAR